MVGKLIAPVAFGFFVAVCLLFWCSDGKGGGKGKNVVSDEDRANQLRSKLWNIRLRQLGVMVGRLLAVSVLTVDVVACAFLLAPILILPFQGGEGGLEAAGAVLYVAALVVLTILAMAAYCGFSFGERAARLKMQGDLYEQASDCCEWAASITEELPKAVNKLFAGKVPSGVRLDADRACAPTTEGVWRSLADHNAVFKLTDARLALYVCADIMLVARYCARKDAAAACDMVGRECFGGEMPEWGFVYNKVYRIATCPDEDALERAIIKGLSRCKSVVSYESLEITVGHAGGVATCRVRLET